MSITRIPWEVLQRIDGQRGGRHYIVPDPEGGEGIRVPSVTNILSVIAKPALVNWAAKVERELVLEAAANLYLDLPHDPAAPRMKRDAYVRTLTTRIGEEKAHQKVARKATDIGGEAHELIEWNLKRELGQEAGAEPRVSPAAATAFSAFQTWWAGSGLKPVRVEQMVFHPGALYAGTLDLLAKANDELIIVDFKTSKAIYEEYLLQVGGAYGPAVNAMGHGPITRGLIVRFPKGEAEPAFNPGRDIQEVTGFDRLHQVFRHAQALWEWKNAAGLDTVAVGKDAAPAA